MTDKSLRARLERRIAVQRLMLGFERLWPLLHWPLVVLGISFAVIASGLLQYLDGPARLGVLVSLALVFAGSLRGVLRFIAPSRLSAMRRLEAAATISHRALSSVEDRMAAEFMDPRMDAMWEEHQRRQLSVLNTVKVSAPRSAWRAFDPQALRVPVFLVALVALLLGTGDLTSNLKEATRLVPAVAPKPLTLDAWLRPPAYTGKPPLLLTAPSMAEKLARGENILVPENSQFTARIAGASDPSFAALDDRQQAIADLAGLAKVAADTLAIEFKVARPMTLVLSDANGELARFPISVVPDQAPAVAISKTPREEGRGTLVLEWFATDDYGVKSISGELTLADDQNDGVGFDNNGIFLFEPPKLKLALKRPNAKEDKGKATQDFASHPWAGLKAVLSLSVKDGAGQEGVSKEVTFTMPERQFVRPMAQALIEQRKKIIFYPEKARDVGRMLDTLMLYPAGLIDSSGPVVSISVIASRLRNARGYDDVKQEINELWDVAVLIEEGALDDARKELQALKNELQKALQDGAPPERIAELMKQLREAMDKFMDQMQQEAERRARDGSLSQQQQNRQRDGRTVSREDLQKMLDALEEMAKGGSKDMAQQMLDELERMLQNMEPGMAQQPGEGDGALSEMLDQLGRMMQQQQRLMDDTQKQQGDGQQPGNQGPQSEGDEGQQGGQGKNGKGEGHGTLADRQRSLKEMLDRLMRENGAEGGSPSELGEALRNMQGAEQGLRESDRDGALRDEGAALDNLRRGANRMAQQLRENGQGQAEGQAEDGEGRGGEDDPLGRPRATRNPDTGPDKNMVPTEQAIRRAREILETLRSRSNEQGLSDSEKGYLERLLRGLY